MPAKNRIKIYVPDAYYHIYNRGVEKRIIFTDQQDYSVFLNYAKTYLLPKETERLNAILSDPDKNFQEKYQANRLLNLNNFSDKIDLIAYCLMPNHFHLLVHQHSATAIDEFMNSLGTRYSMYFNKRHRRVGPLFQDLYKAVQVDTDEQLLHLTRYIHRNLWAFPIGERDKQPSSYPVYLGKTKQPWVKPDIILDQFEKSGFSSYQSFVESEDSDFQEQSAITVVKVALDLPQE